MSNAVVVGLVGSDQVSELFTPLLCTVLLRLTFLGLMPTDQTSDENALTEDIIIGRVRSRPRVITPQACLFLI